MRPRVFSIAATLSALLLVAFCLLWVRSHFSRDYGWTWLRWSSDGEGKRWLKLDFDGSDGELELSWKLWTAAHREQVRQRNDLVGRSFYHRAFADVPRHDPDSLGFRHYSGPTHSSITFPYWFAVLVTTILPAVWVIKRLPGRTLKKFGLCPSCGYDLRATPDRCPECGFTSDQRAVTTKS